ncbi:hypothetical protein NQZ79_g6007 [Umbelopsis isabellina]|nr:hypothetical protein NQZ79_g6007 [Umbelopsis isabellina]
MPSRFTRSCYNKSRSPRSLGHHFTHRNSHGVNPSPPLIGESRHVPIGLYSTIIFFLFGIIGLPAASWDQAGPNLAFISSYHSSV